MLRRPRQGFACITSSSAAGLGVPLMGAHIVPCSLTSSVGSYRHLIDDGPDPRPRTDVYKLSDNEKIIERIKATSRGKLYIDKQSLWPNLETMERDITEQTYSAAERLPASMLPQIPVPSDPSAGRLEPQRYRTPSRGVARLCQLATMDREEFEDELSHLAGKGDGTSRMLHGGAQHRLVGGKEEEEESVHHQAQEAQQQQQQQGAEEDALRRAGLGPPETLFQRLMDERTPDAMFLNEHSSPSAPILLEHDSNEDGTRQQDRIHERLKAVCAWSTTGLDPFLAKRAREVLGDTTDEKGEKKGATRAQSRLLAALLDPSHKDVVFSSDHSTGKTTALALAALHGIRCESTGLNVLLAQDEIEALRMKKIVEKIVGRYGGRIIDRPAEDMSWFFFAPDFNLASYYRSDLGHLVTQSKQANGNSPPRLLITTADTLCEMMFRPTRGLQFEPFGFLRRVYVDDVASQVPRVNDQPETRAMIRYREDNPTAVELALGSFHQLLTPGIRSILQLAAVSAKMPARLREHLDALCLKPTASTAIMTAERLPSTVDTLFSFYAPMLHQGMTFQQYFVKFMRSLNPSIPGRAILLVPKGSDPLEARVNLRRLGMDAKVLSEVYDAQKEVFLDPRTGCPEWKFLLLHESDALTLNIPYVSHVVYTYPPPNRYSFLHVSKRLGTHGSIGWLCVVCQRTEAQEVHKVVSELEVSVKDNTVTEELEPIAEDKVWDLVKPLPLWDMDPQFVVQAMNQTVQDNDSAGGNRVELFDSRSTLKKDDYTPREQLLVREVNARVLKHDFIRNPETATRLRELGYLNARLHPTDSLRRALEDPDAMRFEETGGLRPKGMRKKRYDKGL